jgi:hypothetical protein
LAVVAEVTPAWLVRCVVETARRQLGACPPDLEAGAQVMAAQVAPGVVADLRELLDTDVDEQRLAPLEILRRAVIYPTRLLLEAGISPVPRDEFEERSFPSDVFRLSPATWADVDQRLHESAIMWGAWKAAVVLQRRREEGRR